MLTVVELLVLRVELRGTADLIRSDELQILGVLGVLGRSLSHSLEQLVGCLVQFLGLEVRVDARAHLVLSERYGPLLSSSVLPDAVSKRPFEPSHDQR